MKKLGALGRGPGRGNLISPQVWPQLFSGDARRRLNLNRATSGNGCLDAFIPSGRPFVNGPRGYPKLVSQFGTGTGGPDSVMNGVRFHGNNHGTDSSGCQIQIFAESSWIGRHAKSMDRAGFSRRLAHALDLNGVGRAAIDRKRYLASMMEVTERQAGNYLSGTKLPATEGLIDMAKKLGVSIEWLVNGTLPIKPLRLTQDQAGVLDRLSKEQIDRLFQIGGILAPEREGDPPLPVAA